MNLDDFFTELYLLYKYSYSTSICVDFVSELRFNDFITYWE